jgi:hypothetical protein
MARWGQILYAFDAFDDRLDLQDHAGATTKRPVIDFMMFIARPEANVVPLNIHQARVNGFLQKALTEITVENCRKQGQNIESHVVSGQ